MKVVNIPFKGKYKVSETGVNSRDARFLSDLRTWQLPPIDSVIEINDQICIVVPQASTAFGELTGILLEDRQSARGKHTYGAIISNDLVVAAAEGRFEQAIVPPVIAAAENLWGKKAEKVGYMFSVPIRDAEWKDMFDNWHQSENKSPFFNCHRLSEKLNHLRVFPDCEKLEQIVVRETESVLEHQIWGPGYHLKARLNVGALGEINSDMQKGPIVIASGILTASLGNTNIRTKSLDIRPNIISLMNGLIEPIKVIDK